MTSDSSFIERVVGLKVMRVRRVHFSTPEDTDRGVGPPEVSFDDGSTLLIDSGPDGEAVRIQAHSRLDPFDGRLDETNRSFIATSGKWSAFDVAHEEPYSSLVGGVVAAAR